MSGNRSENPGREDPFLPQASELRAAMKNTSNGPRFSPADLHDDPKAAHDALLHWDEQSEQILRLLALHPEHGGRLETLQRADGWLRQSAAKSIVARTQNGENGPRPDLLGDRTLDLSERGSPILSCPPADELYDFASGPGASPLPLERRLVIDRHLAACAECDHFVGTLSVAPPSPLLLGREEVEAVSAPGVQPQTFATAPTGSASPTRLRRFPRLRIAIPLAAAAALVLAFGIWRAFAPVTQQRATWPEAPRMRGEAAGALTWPRGRVLPRTEAAARSAAWLAGPIPFELDVAPGAAELRIQVFQTAGGAFDAPSPFAEWTTTSLASTSPALLPEGHYTWKAWTRERGLDIELGSRDFEVVSNDALLREIAELLDRDDGIRAVGLLESRGYAVDARALARTLPASPERDAYLARKPAR